MDTRPLAAVSHGRFLGVFVGNLFRDLMAPVSLRQSVFDVLLLATVTVIVHWSGIFANLQVRLAYALFATLISLSVLASLWYHIKVWRRFLKIRRASRG